MLTIVEHEQEPLGAERLRNTLRRHCATSQFEPERGRDRDRDKIGVRQWSKLGDPNPVGKCRQQLPSDLDAQCSLADASDTRKCDEPMLSNEIQDLPELGVSADELGETHRKVSWGVGRN